jgi:hypothetical protein
VTVGENKTLTFNVTTAMRSAITRRWPTVEVTAVYESGNIIDGPGFCFDVKLNGRSYNVEVAGPPDSDYEEGRQVTS